MSNACSRRDPGRRGFVGSMNARRFLIAPAAAVTGLLALGTAATATTVVPELITSDNPTCADVAPTGTTWTEAKLDFNPAPDTYTRGDLHITIVANDADGLDWSADKGISAVIMKGGPSANVYRYDPAATADTDMVTPVNPNGNAEDTKNYGISHVTFCYGPATPPAEEDKPPTPQEEKPPAPETPAPVTPEPEVQATATAAPVVEAAPEAQVLGVQLAAPAAAPLELPRTGSQSRLLAIIGTALVAFGGAALALSGRPTRRA